METITIKRKGQKEFSLQVERGYHGYFKKYIYPITLTGDELFLMGIGMIVWVVFWMAILFRILMNP